MEPDHGSISWFFEYLWVPILGVGAYFVRKRDTEVAELTEKVQRVSDDLGNYKVYGADNFVKQTALQEVKNTMNRMDDKLDEVLKILATSNNRAHH